MASCGDRTTRLSDDPGHMADNVARRSAVAVPALAGVSDPEDCGSERPQRATEAAGCWDLRLRGSTSAARGSAAASCVISAVCWFLPLPAVATNCGSWFLLLLLTVTVEIKASSDNLRRSTMFRCAGYGRRIVFVCRPWSRLPLCFSVLTVKSCCPGGSPVFFFS